MNKMIKRSRPRQHFRRLSNGKKIVVNKGRRKVKRKRLGSRVKFTVGDTPGRMIILEDQNRIQTSIKAKDFKKSIRAFKDSKMTPRMYKDYNEGSFFPELKNKRRRTDHAYATGIIKGKRSELKSYAESVSGLRNELDKEQGYIKRQEIENKIDSHKKKVREINQDIEHINKTMFPKNER